MEFWMPFDRSRDPTEAMFSQSLLLSLGYPLDPIEVHQSTSILRRNPPSTTAVGESCAVNQGDRQHRKGQ